MSDTQKQTDGLAGSEAPTCSPSLIPSDERHPCRTWAANEHKETVLVLADYADHLATERDEWKAALLRIHPTGRGTPDEMATDVIEGIEASKVAIALPSEKRPRSAARNPRKERT